MLHRVDTALCYLVTGLGAVLLALTPVFAGSFLSDSGLEYMGAALAVLILGLLHVARIRSQHPSTRTPAIVATVMILIYCGLVAFVAHERLGLVVGVVVLALGYTCLANRPEDRSTPPTTA
jgi:hypothetical protein